MYTYKLKIYKANINSAEKKQKKVTKLIEPFYVFLLIPDRIRKPPQKTTDRDIEDLNNKQPN